MSEEITAQDVIYFTEQMEDFLDIPSFVCELIKNKLFKGEYEEVIKYIIQRRREIESEQIENVLMPCPFCGGEAEIVQYVEYGEELSWYVHCTKSKSERNYCPMQFIETWNRPSKELAIEAWNTRAEKTCYIIKDNINWLELSCYHSVDNIDAKFCPYCGAKIIDKNKNI